MTEPDPPHGPNEEKNMDTCASLRIAAWVWTILSLCGCDGPTESDLDENIDIPLEI